jgi:general secretion pathway protein M
MSAIKHLFAARVRAGSRPRVWIDLRGLLKSGHLEIGKPAGAVLMLGFIYIAAISLYWISNNALTTMQMTYDARQDLLSALQRRSETAGTYLGKGTDLKHRNPFLSAATETLAAAQLDDELRRVTDEEHGIVLSSHAEIDHDDQAPGNKIEIKTVVESKIEAIQALLFRLETSAPMIFVEELDLEQKNEGIQGSLDTDPMLHANLTLAAYWHDPGQKELQR